jgi:hypothetical protein
MEVHSESPVKTGVTTPVSTQSAPVVPTREQLAKQGKEVLDAFQEASVLGRKRATALVRACKVFCAFEQNARRAKADDEVSKIIKSFTLKPEREKEYLKRVRTIGEAAAQSTHGGEFAAIQNSLSPYIECVYEVAKVFLYGTNSDRKRVVEATADGRLTVNSVLEDIRAICNPQHKKPSARGGKEGRGAPSSVSAANPESLTDEQIVKDARAKGITSPEKQQEVVRQYRQAEAAEAAKLPPPAVVPSEERSHTFRLEDMAFSDVKVEGTTITGRFAIKIEKAMLSDPFWFLSLPLALNRAIQEASR